MIRLKNRFGKANRKEMSWMSDLMETLRQEGISPDLLRAVEEYRAAHALPEALRPRIPVSGFTYYGREVWEQALAALLCGENLLLAGGKATGKNVLAENLAAAFGRPAWDISFHVNMDAASLIGMDTFVDGAVTFRPGPVYRCAQCGGFGVLDEINMAKNEALAVLHAVLDFRRAIDVPGYERIPLAEETRFIATMNYGYAGTRELNEALTSRFAVIQMPTITEENLEKLLRAQFTDLTDKYVHQFALLFLDLQKKCDSAEISTKALDLRGMLDALRLMRRGVAAGPALDMGITNKAFDSYEQGLIRDVIAARIPASQAEPAEQKTRTLPGADCFTVVPESVTRTSADFTLTNEEDAVLALRSEYWLETLTDGEWQPLTSNLMKSQSQTDESALESTVCTLHYDWQTLYGEVEPGDYRLAQPVILPDGSDYTLYAEFTIE